MKLKPIKSNMTELQIGDKTVLFSYETPVAYNQEGVGFFRTETHYSVTTSKHINQWLKGAKAQEVEQTVIDEIVQ